MEKGQERRAVRVSDLSEEEIAMIADAEIPAEFDYGIDDIEGCNQSGSRQQLTKKDTKTPH